MPERAKVVAGKTYNDLTALHECKKRIPPGYIAWKCRCKCGKTCIVRGAWLVDNHTKSCGCRRGVDHGGLAFQNGKLHSVWCAMISRCTNPENEVYPLYGGRGIKVCKRWLNSFEAFLKDMGTRPKGAQLDRRNNDKGYSPSNCRWTTRVKNCNNTRKNVLVTYKGREYTIAELSRKLGMTYNQTYNRYRVNGRVRGVE